MTASRGAEVDNALVLVPRALLCLVAKQIKTTTTVITVPQQQHRGKRIAATTTTTTTNEVLLPVLSGTAIVGIPSAVVTIYRESRH